MFTQFDPNNFSITVAAALLLYGIEQVHIKYDVDVDVAARRAKGNCTPDELKALKNRERAARGGASYGSIAMTVAFLIFVLRNFY